jgi:hypothetical protein
MLMISFAYTNDEHRCDMFEVVLFRVFTRINALPDQSQCLGHGDWYDGRIAQKLNYARAM